MEIISIQTFLSMKTLNFVFSGLPINTINVLIPYKLNVLIQAPIIYQTREINILKKSCNHFVGLFLRFIHL